MFQDIRFSVRDGSRLYARRYAGANRAARSLVCLPGLVGNCAQFDGLAHAIAQGGAGGRDVHGIDLCGRGRSDPAAKGSAAALLTDAENVLDYMAMAGLGQAAIIGTGHGGQIAIVMAVLQPTAVGAIIFNDSGPEFEMEGLARLMGLIANVPVPASWQDARVMMRRLLGRQYPRLREEQWLELAKADYLEADGRPRLAYDPAIAKSFSLSRGTAYRNAMWPQFEALTRVPMLLVRGALSDMLSPVTLARMHERHQGLATVVVADQGHPPLLRDAGTIAAIADFLARNEVPLAAGEPALKAVA